MKTAYDYAEISKLVMSHIKPGVVTNNFMSKSDYIREIENRSLFYIDSPEGLVVLRARNGFCRMNYTLNSNSLPAVPEDEDMVTEHVFRPGESTSDPDFLKSAGFKPILNRLRMFRPAGQEHTCGSCESAIFAQAKHAGAVMAVLKECFAQRTGCLPESDELISALNSQNIIICQQLGDITGVLHFTSDKSGTQIRHLAVSQQYRGKGLARQMVNLYLTATDMAKSTVWVSEDNKNAIDFYTKNGYSPDGWKSRVFEKGR